MRRARLLALGCLLGTVMAVLLGPRFGGRRRCMPRSRPTRSPSSLLIRRQSNGAAPASRVLAVGAIVPWAKANVGAVATQALTNRDFGPNGLALLTKGMKPDEVMKR